MLVLGTALAACAGCHVGPGGEFESLSGGTQGSAGTTSTTATTGGESTGFPPDEVACDYELGANPLGKDECEEDVNCCPEPIASLNYACPSNAFPNNWRCESGVCRQRASMILGDGCLGDDCDFPGFECVVDGGVGHCLAPCANDAECTSLHNMPDSTCESVGAGTYCIQPLP